ncbi:uncharacterized protein LOC134254994 [Saccostrea cucullata]|uniref:uncharacterized protein LOC134254994 n=1 Tax=Saccostrea cuccullata TaxID=36930 RepID=UPI002ED331FC
MMKYKGVMDDAIIGMVSVLRSVVFQIYARDARAKRKDIDITLLEKARNHPCEKYLEDYLQSTENITSLKDTFQGGIEEVISTLQEALLSVLVKGEGGISLDIGQTTMKVNRTQLEEVSYGVEDDIPVEEMEEEIVCEDRAS